MNILAITNHFESSVCLLNNGKLFAASEERFSRKKNQDGIPYLAIKWALSESKIKLEECHKIIYCSIGSVYPSGIQEDQILSDIINSRTNYKKKIILHRALSEAVYNFRAIESFKNWAENNKISDNKIVFIDHHEAHAKSVVNFYGLKDATIFTCDGKGGFTSSAVWSYKKNKLLQQSINSSHNSLGYLFGNFTISLGYKAERHEGKLTGLAAHTKAPTNYNELNPFFVENGKIKSKDFKGIYFPFFNRYKNLRWDMDKFTSILKKWTPKETAATAQKILEDTLIKWISQNITKEVKNICLSGGVFANVRMNQKIREKFKNQIIYVNPLMSDLGLVLGGININLKKLYLNKGLYLGPNFDKSNKITKFKKKNYKYIEIPNIKIAVKKSIEFFKKKSPIGVFHGAMEFGPRALCHRSIIYPATDKTCNKWLNERLNRSEFMPFAPVILDIHAKKYFKDYDENQITAEFMTITYDCKDEFIKKAPAAIHVDGTARPQILKKNKDPWFYNFLYNYIKTTGEVCLLNTSFNNHEEPIVCSPSDALASLAIKNVDAILFATKFLIVRK